MTTLQEIEYILIKKYAEQKLREEFDASKHFWEQDSLMEAALRMGLTELHKEMKEDLKVSVTEQRMDDSDFKTNAGWPKF